MASVNATAEGLGFSDAPEDEFEEAQMLCSYEYGEWGYENDTRDEYA